MENLLRQEPYRVNLEYRVAEHRSTIHEAETEIFYVVEGSGTMVIGGKLLEEARDGTNRHGTGIEGGTPTNIAKGDFIIIPINTAHWLSAIDKRIVLVSIHIPKG